MGKLLFVEQELDGLIEDNAVKTERDRTTLWRKIQKYIARIDDIAKECTNVIFVHATNSP